MWAENGRYGQPFQLSGYILVEIEVGLCALLERHLGSIEHVAVVVVYLLQLNIKEPWHGAEVGLPNVDPKHHVSPGTHPHVQLRGDALALSEGGGSDNFLFDCPQGHTRE